MLKLIRKIPIYIFLLIFLFLVFKSSVCFAKAVKVEEIIAKKGEWQASVLFSYTNIHKKEGKSGSVLIELPDGIITIPSFIGEENVNEDLLSYSFMLKRGIKKDLELYSFINSFAGFRRITLNNKTHLEYTHIFDSLGIGASYQILKENKYPALIVSLSAYPIDNDRFITGNHVNYFKTYSIGLISYYTDDPVVFMFQSRYQLTLERPYQCKRTKKLKNINPSDIFFLSPQIYFAVNPYTTINWGVKWRIQGESTINGKLSSETLTSVSYIFGFGYEFKKKVIIFMDSEYNTLLGESTVRLNLTGRF